MFEIAREAKLQPHDLAIMLKVSRVTVSLWMNGHKRPHYLLRPKVQKLLDGVGRAVEAGDLPVPHDLSRAERGPYINKVLIKHLKGMSSDGSDTTTQ